MTGVAVPVCVLYSWYLWQGLWWAGACRRRGLRVYRRRQDQTRQRWQKDPCLRIFHGKRCSKTFCCRMCSIKQCRIRNIFVSRIFCLQGFGRANHAVSTEKLKTRYPDYEITWANEGYWFAGHGFDHGGLSVNNPQTWAVHKATACFLLCLNRMRKMDGTLQHVTTPTLKSKEFLINSRWIRVSTFSTLLTLFINMFIKVILDSRLQILLHNTMLNELKL